MDKSDHGFAWFHVVVVGLIYAFIILLSCVLADLTNFASFYVAYALLVPIVMLFACWAATGPGNLLTRVVVFSVLGPAIAVTGYWGLSLNQWTAGMFFGSETSWLQGGAIVFMFLFGLCAACQLPFWILRLTFGWRLASKDRAFDELGLSISNLFVVTAIYALAFSLIGYGINMTMEAAISETKVGSTEYFDQSFVDQPEFDAIREKLADEDDIDSAISEFEGMESIQVTSENIEQVRQLRRNSNRVFRDSIYIAVLVYCAVLAVLALLFSPVVWFSLRYHGTAKGLISAGVYLASLFLIPALLILFFSFPGQVSWVQTLSYLFGYCTVFTFAGVIPMAISRSRGIRLVTKRGLRQRKVVQQSTE